MEAIGTCLLLGMLISPAPAGASLLSGGLILGEEMNAEPARDEKVAAYLRGHTLVFVGGFLNEFVRHRFTGNYFRQNIRAASKLDRAAGALRIFPPSSRRIEENVAFLEERLSDAWERGGRKPLTVIGHSKGGAETLLTVLRHPDLILDGVVDHVVLIQAAIGGSPLADCLAAPELCRPRSCALRLAGRMIRRRYRPGLLSLRTADADAVFNAALAEARRRLDERRFSELSGHVFYVRSAAARPGLTMTLRLSADLLRQQGHDLNDGMLLPEDQRHEGIGTDLGEVLPASHADLVCSGIGVSKRAGRYRAAFTRLMLKALASAGGATRRGRVDSVTGRARTRRTSS